MGVGKVCYSVLFNDQLDAQLYQYVIWYMSLYEGDRLVCRFGRTSQPAYQTVTYIV